MFKPNSDLPQLPDPDETIKKVTAAERMLMSTDDSLGAMQKYTIFLVEDDPDDRDQMYTTIKKSSMVHNVHWFESGDDMLRHFVREGYYNSTFLHTIPTMIMLDIALPGTDGLNVLKKLKDNPLTKDIPIVMVTGHVSDETTTEAFRRHANAFIAKPLQLDKLHDVMLRGTSWPRASEVAAAAAAAAKKA